MEMLCRWSDAIKNETNFPENKLDRILLAFCRKQIEFYDYLERNKLEVDYEKAFPENERGED